MKDISFPQIEHDVLKFWNEKDIFKKSLEQSKNGEHYVFYDGPPFATGLPHFGNLLAQTLKDIIPRYQTMRGHFVDRRFGWDCHGLPIEHEINKQLGLDAHEALEQLGIKEYNMTCRGIVQKYAPQWQTVVERMGRWVDFENDYKTMDVDFMESVWWVFKSLWDKGLIYHGNRVVPYSTALGTPLANFEANSNYQMVQDPAVTILAPMKDHPNRMLMLWTTTPWSLISNLAITVHPEFEYVVVKDPKHDDQELVLAKSRVEALLGSEATILETFKGSDLVGKRYVPFYPYFDHLNDAGAFQIISDGYVSDQDGTGLVSNAPSFGEDDERICIAFGIPTDACPIDEGGHFTDDITLFKGMYVKDADKAIIKELKERARLWDHHTIEHSYPFCPRTNTPLIYRTIPSWFVNVTSIKEKMIQKNKEIHWVPDHIQTGRFGKWIENARDWSISRNRVWGNPIPIWINDKTKETICVGSIAELEKLSGQSGITDLHREYVDEITFTINGQPGVYRRTSEVLDCWFESGAMPFAQIHYPFENEDSFKQGFPAQFIAEGLDQTRGWFYTLHIIACAICDQPAFKNVIVNGIILAESGKKMSKSLKNYTPPEELIQTFGADALRLYMISGGLVKGEEQRFSDAGVKEMVRSTLLPWYSAFNFLVTYGKIDLWTPNEDFAQVHLTHPLDQWIISRLESLKERIHVQMNGYKLYAVIPELLMMIEELTNVYIRLNRSRFWSEGMNDDKKSAYSTLYQCIHDLSLMMAPFTPFIAEHIYQQLQHTFQSKHMKESVHLCSYPIANKDQMDIELEATIGLIDKIIRLGRQSRNDNKIKVKTPLNAITIIHEDKNVLIHIKKYQDIILQELNVKTLVTDQNISNYINLGAKPNAPILGKKLGKGFKEVNQGIRSLTTDQIRSLEKTKSLTISGHTIGLDELFITRTPLADSHAVANEHIAIALDLDLNDDLILEGLAREVVNRIQKTRKTIGLEIQDRISIDYHASDFLRKAFERHHDLICKETLCKHLHFVSERTNSDLHSFDIDSHMMQIQIQKVQ